MPRVQGDTAHLTLPRFLRRFLPLCARRIKATEGRRRALLAATPSCACCSSSPKISHRFARCDFRGPHYWGTLIINGRKFTLFPKAASIRLLGGAFSGYARGWFLTMPYRALLASASASPPCSRKSRFAAIFRESAVLYLFVIITRANRITFLRQRTQFADTSAHGKGEAAAL